MRHLLICGILTRSLADAFAEEKNRTGVCREDMLQAVRLADFTFSASPFFRLRSARKWLNHLSQLQVFATLLRF